MLSISSFSLKEKKKCFTTQQILRNNRAGKKSWQLLLNSKVLKLRVWPPRRSTPTTHTVRIKYNLKTSSSVALATFLVLNNHKWLGTRRWYREDTEHYHHSWEFYCSTMLDAVLTQAIDPGVINQPLPTWNSQSEKDKKMKNYARWWKVWGLCKHEGKMTNSVWRKRVWWGRLVSREGDGL